MHNQDDHEKGSRESSAKLDVWQVLITEFSYRGHNNGARDVDPLDPQRLDFRFRVFEISCVPSVLAQTNQDFDWIVIIDKCLSTEYREKILQCVGHRRRTYLHEFSSTEDLTGSAWLKKYAQKDARYLITTLLDDDDTLPMNFFEAVRLRIGRVMRTLPCLVTLGYKSSLQWELIASKNAPLGYKCSWHRGTWVRAAGVSMLCELKEDLCVLALGHWLADVWFETGKGDALSTPLLGTEGGVGSRETLDAPQGEIEKFRIRAHSLVERALSWRDRQGEELFIDLTDLTGPVVMTNHYFNDIVFRLLEYKPDRSRVTGRDSFPNTVVRFDVLERDSAVFRKSWRMYRQLLGQRGQTLAFGFGGVGKIRLAAWGLWRFMRL
jgi:hypothetical protein